MGVTEIEGWSNKFGGTWSCSGVQKDKVQSGRDGKDDTTKPSLISQEVMHDLESKGFTSQQVINLLREMEMVDENREDIWEE
jgi:hypothetical protein